MEILICTSSYVCMQGPEVDITCLPLPLLTPCLLIDWLDLLASKPAASCVSALFQKHPASMRELEVKSQSLVFTL